jgi:hypothetical protein
MGFSQLCAKRNSMDEKRETPRYRVQKHARIGGVTGIPCVVRELSATGARLSVPDTVPIPNRFDLLMTDEQLVMPARVIWRAADAIGITFDGAPHGSVGFASQSSQPQWKE